MNKHKLILIPLVASFLCGCDASHYKATFLVTSQQKSEGSISFEQFEGQYVLKLRKTSAGEGPISFTASLGEGKMEAVYKTFDNVEQPLFTINSGESKEDKLGYIEKGYKVVIILRSDGKVKNGKFTFNLN